MTARQAPDCERTDNPAIDTALAAGRLDLLFNRLTLRHRFMAVPLLALILISALTAGFAYHGARQAALLDRIATVDLVEHDLHADLMNDLLVEHLALHSMLQNAAAMDRAALHEAGKEHLGHVFEAVRKLEQLMPTVASPGGVSSARAAWPAKLVPLMQAYRQSVATAVEAASIDPAQVAPLVRLANERFGALTVGFEQLLDLLRDEMRTEIREQVRLSRWANGLEALAGAVAALLLLALSFVLSRLLVRALERQVNALADLGQQAGAVAPEKDGDEVERIAHAIAAFRGVLVQLQRSEAEFRSLAEAMPQIVWTTRADGGGLFFSRQWMEYTGLTLDQSLRGGWLGPMHPDDRATALEARQAAAVTLGNPSFECRLRRADGVYRWWLVRGAPLLGADGEVLKWFGTCTDINDLKELNTSLEQRVDARTAELKLAREEADRANQAKSDFLATMSHEIRTPMNGLMGLLELLGLSELDAEQRGTLGVARESGVDLLHLIDGILDFSKIEANHLELDPAPASVREAVENACQLQSQIASSKSLTLQSHVAPEISPRLSFDAFRLGQILNNFLNNAIKFTEQGTVDVSVELVGRSAGREQLRFSVRDTGIGISAEALTHLFQPFMQADVKTSSRFGGTGLGLVISRRLAELMGGSVEVRSEPGGGTTMSLLVAFAPCQAGPQARGPGSTGDELLRELMVSRRPAPSVAQAEKEGSLLLVVDDHPTNRMMLTRQVSSLGYAAEAANDGVQALQLFASGRFSAVITDCNMPKMNGYELATAIRDHEQKHGQRAIPIIGCTANALRSATEDCIRAGMDDCLVKPVGLADISGKLEQWLPLARVGRLDTVAATLPLPPAPAKVPAAGEGLLDLLLLEEITEGNTQMRADMLAEFQRVNELDATALRLVAGRDDFVEAYKHCHRIKGASLMLGAGSLAEHCSLVEAACADRSPSRLRAAMHGFEPALLLLHDYIDQLSVAGAMPPAQRAKVEPLS